MLEKVLEYELKKDLISLISFSWVFIPAPPKNVHFNTKAMMWKEFSNMHLNFL